MSKKKKKEEEPKSSLKFFLLASIVLFVFLAISIYHNSKNPFTQVLQEYVVNKQEIHDYQPTFMALREHGFVGEERRLDWIE